MSTVSKYNDFLQRIQRVVNKQKHNEALLEEEFLSRKIKIDTANENDVISGIVTAASVISVNGKSRSVSASTNKSQTLTNFT